MPASLNPLGPDNSLLAAALEYARAGYRVFPLHPRSKEPATDHGFLNATTDLAQIEEWWQWEPDHNVGIATGKQSAGFYLTVVDLDPPKMNGEAPDLPPTATVRTGGGGQHFYYRTQQEVRNSASKLAPGIDVRGEGGYVVAPPSVHASGEMYGWETPLEALAEMPPTLLDLVCVSPPRAADKQTQQDGPIPEGKRDTTLASLAGSMRRRGMRPGEIEAALLAVNLRCVPPLSEDQVRKIAVSVGRYATGEQQELEEEVRRLKVRERAREIVRQERERDRYTWPPSAASLADELEVELEETTWSIEDWLPHGGNANVAGPKKAGKTVLLLNIARCAVDGEPFLGKWEIRELSGRVGYFNFEMTRRQFRGWQEQLHIYNKDRIWPLTARGYRLPMIVEAVAERMIEELRSHEVELWIIDTKQRAQLGSVRSEYDNDEIARWLDLMDVIKAEAGVKDLILSSHFGHGEERTRGASAILGWADANWKLTVDRDKSGEEHGRFLEAEGRDVDQAPHQLRFDPNNKRLTLAGRTRVQVRVDHQLRLLCQAVASNDGIATGPLYDAIPGDRSDKPGLVTRAEAAGYVRRVQEGRKVFNYITAEGRAFLGSSDGSDE